MATNGMDRAGLGMDGTAHSLNGSGSKMDGSNLPGLCSPHNPLQPSTRIGNNEGVRLVEVPLRPHRFPPTNVGASPLPGEGKQKKVR